MDNLNCAPLIRGATTSSADRRQTATPSGRQETPMTTPLVACSACHASAGELAGRDLGGTTEEGVLNEAGLRRRSGGDLVCEDCWRLLMRQQ